MPSDGSVGTLAPPAPATSAWAPLGHPTFRALWLAVLASTIGTWVQDVAAAWYMSEQTGSPLMVAAAHNSPPMIGLLMDAGADPDIKNKRGQTARDVAELNGNLEASQAILVLSNARSAKAPEGAAEESTSQ